MSRGSGTVPGHCLGSQQPTDFSFFLPPTQRDQQQVGAFPGLGLRTLSPSVALLTAVWAWDSSWVGSAPWLGHRMSRGFGELSPSPEVLASPAPALSQVEIKAVSMKRQQGLRLYEHTLTHVHTGKSCSTRAKQLWDRDPDRTFSMSITFALPLNYLSGLRTQQTSRTTRPESSSLYRGRSRRPGQGGDSP